MMDLETRQVLPHIINVVMAADENITEIVIMPDGVKIIVGSKERYVSLESKSINEAMKEIRNMATALTSCPLGGYETSENV